MSTTLPVKSLCPPPVADGDALGEDDADGEPEPPGEPDGDPLGVELPLGDPALPLPAVTVMSAAGWTAPGGATEVLMAQLPVFQRRGPLTLDGLAGSGADFPEQFKPHVLDGSTVVLSPHKVYGSSTNDLVLQLRKRRIEKVVMAGPAGNLCVEAHLRDLLEHSFEVAMVRDAIGGTSNEEGDGVQAALVNFRFLAHALWTTDEAVARFADLSR